MIHADHEERKKPLPWMLLVGEALIDLIPTIDRPGEPPCYRPHPGGAAANTAAALARLGGSARFVGKLARDSFGRLLLQVLQAQAVDTRFAPSSEQGNTALALVTLQADGEREFTFYRQRTADTLLEPGELDARVWEDVVLCHAGSVLLTQEPARAATLAALEQARQRHLTISFDVNARPALWTSEAELRAYLERALTYIDLLKFSTEEAHFLDPTRQQPLDPPDAANLLALARTLLARGPALIIITRGPLGALLCTARHMITVPAATLRAIDTTGAGDAFMGAVLYRLGAQERTGVPELAALTDNELRRLGTFACTAAGLSCTRPGGIASLPSLHEVEQAERAR
jgi:fructokinase